MQCFLKNIIIVANQYKIILNTSLDVNIGDETAEYPVLQENTKLLNLQKGDEMWSEAMRLLNDMLNTATKLISVLQKLVNIVPSAEYSLVHSKFIPISETVNIKYELSQISSLLEKLMGIFNGITLGNSLSWLKGELKLLENHLDESEAAIEEEVHINTEDIEKYTQKILIVIQNIFKKYSETKTETDPSSETQEEDEQLMQNHLKSLLVEQLSEDFAILEMKKIMKATHKIASAVFAASPDQTKKLRGFLRQSVLLLEQTLLLYQYFITQQISAYRISCKLNSILLNIFIDLAAKVSENNCS